MSNEAADLRKHIRRIIATNVRRRREELGLSQSELARRTEVTQGIISHIELERSTPKIDTLAIIAKALRTPVSHLLDENAFGESD